MIENTYTLELELEDGSVEELPISFEIELTPDRLEWVAELGVDGFELVAAVLYANAGGRPEAWIAVRDVLVSLVGPETDEDRLSELVRLVDGVDT